MTRSGEEKWPQVVDRLKSGYPRFVIHRLIRELARQAAGERPCLVSPRFFAKANLKSIEVIETTSEGHIVSMRLLILLLLLAALSGCAPVSRHIASRNLTPGNTALSTIVKVSGSEPGENLFSARMYFYNSGSEPIDLNVDEIILFDKNSVLLKKLTSAETELVLSTVKEGKTDNAPLRNSRILPGASVSGSLVWLRHFRYPVILEVVIGGDRHRFEFRLSEKENDVPSRTEKRGVAAIVSVPPSDSRGPIVSTTRASAVSKLTSTEMLSQCTAALLMTSRPDALTIAQIKAEAWCRGYIDGIATPRAALLKEYPFCVPSETENEAVTRAVADYLRDSREDNLSAGAPTIIKALQRAFPCNS